MPPVDPTDANIELGIHLRVARVLLGWSQAQLAAAAHVGVATIKRIETGAMATRVVEEALLTALRNNGIVTAQRAEDLTGVEVEFLIARTVRNAPGGGS